MFAFVSGYILFHFCFQDKLRLLQEDLDSERELRQRIERERSDLQCQLIALSDRLEEAEGGAECQVEMNKKRDTELSKLRFVNNSSKQGHLFRIYNPRKGASAPTEHSALESTYQRKPEFHKTFKISFYRYLVQ